MSLLLDALKKAAEQKAQQSKLELSPERTSDETLLEVAADDASRLGVSGDGSVRLADDDETEFDQSELGARLDRSGRERGAGDDTGLELPDTTETPVGQRQPDFGGDDETSLDLSDAAKTNIQQDLPTPGMGDETSLDIPETDDLEAPGKAELSEQMLTGDDESIIFSSEDATDLAIEAELVEPDQLAREDETDLSQLDVEQGLTEDREQPVDSAAAEDETDLSQIPQYGDHSEDHSEDRDVTIAADETDLSQPQQASDTDDDKVETNESDAIDLSSPIRDRAMVELEQGAADDDETDFNQPAANVDQIETAQAQLHPEDDSRGEEDSLPDRDALVDEDLSLLLIEREVIHPGANTSFTEPKVPQAQDLALEDIAPGLDELALVDSTENRAAEEQTDTQAPTITNPTATLYADDTRTNRSTRTVTRADSTSTRSYAPDNYDRTLMKVASEDASNIFAGMKSESDIVMTPDYAKKVFHSKTSVQRVQHYRVYAVIVFVLVVSVSIFGVLEFRNQSEQIDSSLRALKQDPMPGAIKTAQPEEIDLFTEADALANARTVEIIESANQAESIPVVEETVSQVEGAEVIDTAADSQAVITTAQIEPVTSEPEAESVQPEQPAATRDDSDQVASLASSASGTTQTNAQQNMHITSSSQYQQNDIWLREAYAAYRTGDNQRALSLYNQVLKADPANRNALLARAAIQMHDGNIDAAIRDYQALLLANPMDSLAMSSLLAVGSYSPQKTESQLKLMIREEPDSPYLNFALANAYGAQDRWLEAQRHYFTALQNNPGDPNYAYNLAVSLEHISQPSSAITYYQRALENFTNGLATFNREVVNQRLEILGKL